MNEIIFQNQEMKLFAAETGEGPPLVILHGGLANHLASLSLFSELEKNFRLIAPDIRGSGRSAWSGELTWELLSSDLVALLDHLKIEKANIAGISSGTGVSINFALNFPKRLNKLVLVNPIYGGAAFGLTASQKTAFLTMDSYGQKVPDNGIQSLFPLFEKLSPTIRERAVSIIKTFDPLGIASTTRFLASGEQPFSLESDIQRISQPTFLVAGNDPLHPTEIAELYQRHFSSIVVSSSDQITDEIKIFLNTE